MSEITLHFESPDKTDLQRKAQLLQERLKKLSMVEDAEAHADVTRFTGLEVVGAISVGIAVVGKSREFIAELRKLIPEIKKLAEELGLKKPSIEIGGTRRAISDLELSSDEELGKAATP